MVRSAESPERFARMRPGPDGIEARFVGSPFEETGERATWRSVRPGSQGMARRSTVRSAEMPTESSDDLLMFGPIYEIPQMEVGDPAPRARDGRDDFLSTTERENPITFEAEQPTSTTDAVSWSAAGGAYSFSGGLSGEHHAKQNSLVNLVNTYKRQ